MIALLFAAMLAGTQADTGDVIELTVGHGYMGSHSITSEGPTLVREERRAQVTPPMTVTRSVATPSGEAWARFWARVDEIGVWRWERHYSHPERSSQMDGTRWKLTLRHGAHSITSGGYNATPERWRELERAIDDLTETKND